MNNRKNSNVNDILLNTQTLSKDSEFDISRLKTNCNERTTYEGSLMKISTEPSNGFLHYVNNTENSPNKQVIKLSKKNSNFEEENDIKEKFPRKSFKDKKTYINNFSRLSQNNEALKKYNFLFSDLDKSDKRPTFYAKARSKTVTFKLSDCDLSNQGKLKNPLQNKGDFYEFVEFSQMQDKINHFSNSNPK
jgi:hypothetical protein